MYLLQLIGGIILTVGIWLNLDKKSFLAFTKIVEEQAQVPEVSPIYCSRNSVYRKIMKSFCC